MLSQFSRSSFSSAIRRTPFVNSLNSIVFQNTPLPSKLQPPFLTKIGLSERMQRIKRYFASRFRYRPYIKPTVVNFDFPSLIKLRAKSPEDTNSKLINECSLLYTDFLRAFRTYKMRSIRCIQLLIFPRGNAAKLKSITSDQLYMVQFSLSFSFNICMSISTES